MSMEKHMLYAELSPLYKLREMLGDVILQAEESCRSCQADGGEGLILTHAVDRTLAPAGSLVTYSVVVSNSGSKPVQQVTLRIGLPACMTYVPRSLTVDFDPVYGGGFEQSHTLELGAMDSGELRMIRFDAVISTKAAHNPIEILADAVYRMGELQDSARAEPLQVWVTDRSCLGCRNGLTMAEVVAQWSLAQLFGMPDEEIGDLLLYLQNHKEDILSEYYKK